MEDTTRKHFTINNDNVEKVEDLSKKTYVNQSKLVDNILTEFFKTKKKINIGMTF